MTGRRYDLAKPFGSSIGCRTLTLFQGQAAFPRLYLNQRIERNWRKTDHYLKKTQGVAWLKR